MQSLQTIYAAAKDVPITISKLGSVNIDYGFLNTIRGISADSIVHYDFSLERELHKQAEQQKSPLRTPTILQPVPSTLSNSAPNIASKPSVPIDFSEFEDGLSPPLPWDQPPSLKEDLKELHAALEPTLPKPTPIIRQTAPSPTPPPPALPPKEPKPPLPPKRRLGADHFTDEAKIALFTELYEAFGEATTDQVKDSINLYGNAEMCKLYLSSFLKLKELGFEAEAVKEALFINEAKFEQALDYLMK